MLHLPLELVLDVVDYVAETDYTSLQVLALSCRYLLKPCQRRIFKRVSVKDTENCIALNRVLEISQYLCGFIEELRICDKLVIELEAQGNRILDEGWDSEDDEEDSDDEESDSEEEESDSEEQGNKPVKHVKAKAVGRKEVVHLDTIKALEFLTSRLEATKTLIIDGRIDELRALAQCMGPFAPQITHLNLHCCGIVDDYSGIHFIARFSNLETLEIRGKPRVHVSYNGFGRREPSPRLLARTLVPPSLTRISITWNSFAVTLLKWVLRDAPPIRSLEVFSDTAHPKTPRTTDVMLKLLKQYPQLDHITIDSYGYENIDDVQALCHELRHQTVLKSLKLSRLRFEDTQHDPQEWINHAVMQVNSNQIKKVELEMMFEAPSWALLTFDWSLLDRLLSGPQFTSLSLVVLRVIHDGRPSVTEENIRAWGARWLPMMCSRGMLQFVLEDI